MTVDFNEGLNTAYAFKHDINQIDATILFERNKLKSIFETQLQIPDPISQDLNKLISLFVSSHLLSMRMEGALNVDLAEIIQNMIPY